ncbi:unnamed protein product [Cuscuta epithymum]|uniref:Uncharacterized protein n=1 Tax=Cuscuta epithymum TaxID=186058 RepID=A0AAV0DZ63_9ASTE|nr:unnamed protein product [Cuscuta epithymum]
MYTAVYTSSTQHKNSHPLLFQPINPYPPSFLSFHFFLSFPAPNFLLPIPLSFFFSLPPCAQHLQPLFFSLYLHFFSLPLSLFSFSFLSLSPFLHLFSSLFFFFPVCSHFFCRSKSGQKNRRSHNLNLLCSLKYYS